MLGFLAHFDIWSLQGDAYSDACQKREIYWDILWLLCLGTILGSYRAGKTSSKSFFSSIMFQISSLLRVET